MDAYTDISLVNKYANDGDGNLVVFFGWAIVTKTEDGRIGNLATGVEIIESPSSVKAETRAIEIARAVFPGMRILSDCHDAKGWDAIADKNDPFHQIAHFASRSALYTRLVTSGLPLIGRRKGAEKKFGRAVNRIKGSSCAP